MTESFVSIEIESTLVLSEDELTVLIEGMSAYHKMVDDKSELPSEKLKLPYMKAVINKAQRLIRQIRLIQAATVEAKKQA